MIWHEQTNRLTLEKEGCIIAWIFKEMNKCQHFKSQATSLVKPHMVFVSVQAPPTANASSIDVVPKADTPSVSNKLGDLW